MHTHTTRRIYTYLELKINCRMLLGIQYGPLQYLHTHTHNIVLHFISVSLCRRFGTKCAGCLQGISPSDLVRRARSKVFHLNCFTCMVCNKQLSTGEELYVIDENKFVCKEDYISASAIKEVNLNSGEHDDWSCVYVCV